MEWRAFELHPEIPPEGKVLQKDPERARLSRMALTQMAEEAGLEMRLRDRVSNSRLALEAAEFARSQGESFEPLHRALFVAYWREGRNIGDAQVLKEIGEGAGLDGDAMAKALEERRFQEIVQKQLDQARRLNIFAVPTFIFEGRYVVQGAQPYEVFQRTMEEYVLTPQGEG